MTKEKQQILKQNSTILLLYGASSTVCPLSTPPSPPSLSLSTKNKIYREACRADPVLYKEVRQFARMKYVFPFIVTTVMLVFLLVNLGASSSDSDMPKKVLIGGLFLVLLQFVVVPLLIWRPSDERQPLPSGKRAAVSNGSLAPRVSSCHPRTIVDDSSFDDQYILDGSNSSSSYGGGIFSGRNPIVTGLAPTGATRSEGSTEDGSLAAAVKAALAARSRERSIRGVAP